MCLKHNKHIQNAINVKTQHRFVNHCTCGKPNTDTIQNTDKKTIYK